MCVCLSVSLFTYRYAHALLMILSNFFYEYRTLDHQYIYIYIYIYIYMCVCVCVCVCISFYTSLIACRLYCDNHQRKKDIGEIDKIEKYCQTNVCVEIVYNYCVCVCVCVCISDSLKSAARRMCHDTHTYKQLHIQLYTIIHKYNLRKHTHTHTQFVFKRFLNSYTFPSLNSIFSLFLYFIKHPSVIWHHLISSIAVLMMVHLRTETLSSLNSSSFWNTLFINFSL